MDTPAPLAFGHFFRDLPDPRFAPACTHRFLDILVIGLCAAVSGQFAWTDIEDYGHIHREWLETFLELPEGIPSHDTFRAVFARLDPQAFQRCFHGWIAALNLPTPVPHIAIDGKSLRGSRDQAHGRAALHLVSAWARPHQLTLAQVATAEKSNEITAIPELLRLLSLKGALVTIDAMGCQKAIATQIREQEGHYVLAVKDNQPTLLAEVQAAATVQLETLAADDPNQLSTTERHHGRQETRFYTLLKDLSQIGERTNWPDLEQIVVVWRERTVQGQTSTERSYFLTSYPGELSDLAEVIRGHWGIENQCHWVLDVVFGEDRSRQRARHGAENVGWLRRMALSLLRQEPTPKLTLKQKSRRALCNQDFLLQVLSTVMRPPNDA